MKKTFYLQKNSLYLFVGGLVALFIGRWLIIQQPEYLTDPNNGLSVFFFALEQNYTIISVLALLFLPLSFIIGSRRLIVTDTSYVYHSFLKKQEYSKREYRIIGTGSFEKTSWHGKDSSTEKWQQLDIIDQNELTIQRIKVKTSQKAYLNLVTYLKVAESAYLDPNVETADKSLTTEIGYRPEGDQKIGLPWEGWVFTIIISTFAYVMIINKQILPIPEKARLPLVLLIIVGSLWRNIDWRKKKVLTMLIVTDNGIEINGCHYFDQDILLIELTSSREDYMKHLYHLTLTNRENGRKKHHNFVFKLNSKQVNEYKKIEQAIVETYGAVGKYQTLMAEA